MKKCDNARMLRFIDERAFQNRKDADFYAGKMKAYEEYRDFLLRVMLGKGEITQEEFDELMY